MDILSIGLKGRILILFFVLSLPFFYSCKTEDDKGLNTFCNPLDLNYRFRPETNEVSYREAADPSGLYFKGKYYIFASKSGGYWSSEDLMNWNFIPSKGLPTEDYAPAVIAIGDTLYFAASDYSKKPIFKTADPESGEWEIANPEFPFKIWDPAFFQDDDGRLFLYWGCSPKEPLYGIEIDPKNQMNPIGERIELLNSNISEHGWENPGENNERSASPWLEGPWVNKVNDKYYLQYAAPGTELSTYADGYYVGESPLGPFKYSNHSPFSRKTGGFVTGIGHGSTFQDEFGNYWHPTTTVIAVKHMFERRLSLFQAYFDEDGVMYTNTAYGDYPQVVPEKDTKKGSDNFSGWMLLSYGKPVTASSSLEGFGTQNAVDESLKSYWAAQTDKDEWLQVDLEEMQRINAIQVNFAEHQTAVYGRKNNLSFGYNIEFSDDGKNWESLLNSEGVDHPHAYHPLNKPVYGRYIRLNIENVPDGKAAVSGLRIFGNAEGAVPNPVLGFEVKRNTKDERQAKVRWNPESSAQGYVLRYGAEKDKLYQSIMLYQQNEIELRSLNKGVDYYFTVEAFNASGIGVRSQVAKAEFENFN